MSKRAFVIITVVLSFLFNLALADEIKINFDNPQTKLDIQNSDNIVIPAPVIQNSSNGQGQNAILKKERPKKWTIMVFMNGKNNLEIAGLYNANQMEMIGSDKNINIVVELGRMKGQQNDVDIDGDWVGSRRYLIKNDNDGEKLTSPVLLETPAVDMGDYKRVVDFVKWAKTNFPAKKYMLVLWDHGLGWMDPVLKKSQNNPKAISHDEETNNIIKTVEIGSILKEGGIVDVLAFDACIMQMAEISYEVRDYASVVIGSEEVVPAFGYNYFVFLQVLKKYPNVNAEELAQIVTVSFQKFYASLQKSGVHISALRTSGLSGLGTHLDEWTKLVEVVHDTEAVKIARDKTLRFEILGPKEDPQKTISFYGDLYNFVEILANSLNASNPQSEALKQKSSVLLNYIKENLVLSNEYYGTDRLNRSYADAHGTSIYLPPVETKIPQDKLEGVFANKYTDLSFSKNTRWYDFVKYIWNVKQ